MRVDSTDATTGKRVTQIATVRMFWHPKGGVTTLNPTALNATFRYILMTPDSLGMYEGAGFVRPSSKDGAQTFEARVVDADLRLTQASATFNDTLGRCHLHGYFTAAYDDVRATELYLQAQRDFFAQSLVSKAQPVPAVTPFPTTGPANFSWGMPSTMPALNNGAATEPAPATIPSTQP
jgi:hypothetical protein